MPAKSFGIKANIKSISSFVNSEKRERICFVSVSYTHLDVYKRQVWLNLTTAAGDIIGHLGLVSRRAMNFANIKRVQMAVCELDLSKLLPLPSRDNVRCV